MIANLPIGSEIAHKLNDVYVDFGMNGCDGEANNAYCNQHIPGPTNEDVWIIVRKGVSKRAVAKYVKTGKMQKAHSESIKFLTGSLINVDSFYDLPQALLEQKLKYFIIRSFVRPKVHDWRFHHFVSGTANSGIACLLLYLVGGALYQQSPIRSSSTSSTTITTNDKLDEMEDVLPSTDDHWDNKNSNHDNNKIEDNDEEEPIVAGNGPNMKQREVEQNFWSVNFSFKTLRVGVIQLVHKL